MSFLPPEGDLGRQRDLLGEAPAYDADRGRLLWVDFLGRRAKELLLMADGRWQSGRAWELEQPVSAVVPRRGGGLLAMLGDTVTTLEEDGETLPFAKIGDGDPEALRLNDAKCDRKGRLVVGWVSPDGSRSGGAVRVDADGGVEPIVTGVGYPNGLDWSPDGETFYLVDTAARRIEAFDYGDDAPLTGRRPLLEIERGVGAPDGMAVDHEGCIWVTVPYAGEVRRYGPDGSLVDTLRVPTLMPTSCAFAGPDGDLLFVTSQREGILSPVGENDLHIERDRVEAALRDPMAGTIFACRLEVTGPPATPFGT